MAAQEAFASEAMLEEEVTEVRAGAPRSHARARAVDPDAEAIAIVSHVATRLAVARSVVRIVGGVARESAGVATTVLRAYADRKIAEAGGDRARKVAVAAAHAAKHAVELAAARAVARSEDVDDEGGGPRPLDHEDLRDDGC